MSELIRVENLHKSFGTLEVLKGIDLHVNSGETLVLLGSSGSGKSTLLRCINFMETLTSGRILLNGDAIGSETRGKITYKESDLCKLRTRIGMVFQHFNLFPHMTVLQNVMEGQLTVLGRDKAEAAEKSMIQLTRVGLADKAAEFPSRLSGGQKQRVAIARALAMDPDVMLFDEVTSALDPELVGEVLKTMRQLAEEGMTMICVTHELGFAYHVANRVLFLNEGTIHEEGDPQSVLRNPQTKRMKEFLEGHALFKLPE
ncbi:MULTISPECIES: amino acid ABC transporter ATP-binding protein [Pacificibacter]|uniref:amino acid ABC transporter ATP-binding protein n=1 Tax=Pacificibacter TaxID=1042323 RepID=UPI001C09FB19|nr:MULTISPECIES: amino acid ABC transporter ATP-binding protein [Pacificibacter]MBU2937600.1 amino acid ABC transporter ATP-binding protein [Pacificibacter marinus]MDO6616895.1 amino acid ABC transporter ATP-binding protein [Pacificibacter sp. 1_MG-2023]